LHEVADDCSASWKLEASTLHENLGFRLWKNLRFPVAKKFVVSNRLICNGGMSSGEDLEIKDFIDVYGDGNYLRWGNM
jgi:hypothetical protein